MQKFVSVKGELLFRLPTQSCQGTSTRYVLWSDVVRTIGDVVHPEHNQTKVLFIIDSAGEL